jgi:alkanesulfonate monooxygenase SsuD/methylene tetrahydromethanopterin reductase-like flavin-dependent oxidoreductase (luciferase family)
MDPFVTLTAAAIATKKLRIGTGVCFVAQRDPIQTAKLVASTDQVSGGRFLFRVGGGWNVEEMADHGTAFKTRFKLMRERIAAMKEIWTKNEAEYHGELVDFPPWRWVDPACEPAAIWGRHRIPAALSSDGCRGRPRPRLRPCDSLGRSRRPRPAKAAS